MNAPQRQARRRRTVKRHLARLDQRWRQLEALKQRFLLDIEKERRQAEIHAEYVKEMRGVAP